MALKVIVAPTEEPISVSDAKNLYLKDEFADEILIAGLIKVAREYCEDHQGKKYITQTLEMNLDSFPAEIEFRDCSPVQSITSIKYTTKDGVEKTLDSSLYILDNVSFVNRIVPAYGKQYPSDTLIPVNGVRVQFVCGYGSAAKVPDTVKWAMVLHMQSLYENIRPEERDRLEKARNSLLGMRRVIPV